MTEPNEESSRAIFADVARVYGGVLVVVIGFAVLAQFVGFVAQMLYAIVAFLFYFVPQRILEKRNADPVEYGMVTGNLTRGVAWGLGATLLTLPFFAAGYWVWETQFLQRDFNPDMERYRQWPVEFDGEPKRWGTDGAGVWVWSDRDALEVGLRNIDEPNNRVVLTADQPFKPVKRGTVNLVASDGVDEDGRARKWIATLTHSKSRGVVTVLGPDEIDVRVEPTVADNPVWPMYRGERAEEVDTGALKGKRGLWWLALWIGTQFVLVAFPEEYFYRGFLQTRLEQAFGARARERGKAVRAFLGFTPAIFWTSVLFGIGHLVVPVGGVLLATRMSVFFPALLFGWLRRRTDSIVAPTIYHAFSNMLVLIAAVHFT